MPNKILFILLLFVASQPISAQADSIQKSAIKDYIVPVAFVAYGTLAISNKNIKSFDLDVQKTLRSDNPTTKDNYLPYIPALSIYALKLSGIKSKSSYVDYTMKASLAYIINTGIVHTLKNTTNVLRPDGSSYNSFPSGHTSNAFVGAELLHQEYGEQSIWYSVAGYTIATTTGYLRMYNNRHWFSDVVMGAGLGMLSTKVSYWIYPTLQKWMKREKSDVSFIIGPTANGIGLVYVLK
jgi:membrane-associated phospholipid phosphatase